jgi:hypothetical protein
MPSASEQLVAEHARGLQDDPTLELLLLRRFGVRVSLSGNGVRAQRAPQLSELGSEQLEPTPCDAGGLFLGCTT